MLKQKFVIVEKIYIPYFLIQFPFPSEETVQGFTTPIKNSCRGNYMKKYGSLTLHNLYYIVLALCKAARPAQIKEIGDEEPGYSTKRACSTWPQLVQWMGISGFPRGRIKSKTIFFIGIARSSTSRNRFFQKLGFLP